MGSPHTPGQENKHTHSTHLAPHLLRDSSWHLPGTCDHCNREKEGTPRSSHLLTHAQQKHKHRANHGLLFICLSVSDSPSQTSYTQPFQKLRLEKNPNKLFSCCIFKGRKCTLPKKHFLKSCVSTTDLIYHTNSSPQKCNIPIQKQKMYH